MITEAVISRAVEKVCAHLGLDEMAEEAVAVAVLITARRVDPEPGLTHMETRALQLLQQRAGRCVAMDDICRALDCSDNTVKVVVCRIRKKRPDLAAQISTVWGKGYRWEPAA